MLELIEDEAFNDLHQLTKIEEGLLLANTGNESIDFISLPDTTIRRMDLLSSDLRALRPSRTQSEDIKPHLHHVASACLNSDGEVIVGLGRQARILNATRWEWIGPWLHAGLHDVHYTSDGALWCTTIDGQVHRLGEDGDHRTWQVGLYQDRVGWTRGLALTAGGMLVGTTALRESNRDYYQAMARSRGSTADACLAWIPFEKGQSAVIGFAGSGSRKVFSICAMLPTRTFLRSCRHSGRSHAF